MKPLLSPGRLTLSSALLCLSHSGDHKQKFYWGHKEILIPVFKNMADAMKKHPEVDVLINFASLRSAYDSTMETMNYAQVAHCALGAGGRGSPEWCPPGTKALGLRTGQRFG